MQLRRLVWLVGIVLVCVGAVWAQAEEPLLLQYKFIPGQTLFYEIAGTGNLPMSLETGPAAGNQTIAMDMSMELRLDMRETCEGLDEQGRGKMAVSLPLMTIQANTAIAGQAINTFTAWENDALAITVNGQTLPADENVQKLENLLRIPMKSLMAANGNTTLDAETATLLGDLINNPLSGFTYSLNNLTSGFSDQPVRVGDRWQAAITGEQTNGALEGTSEIEFAGYEEIDGLVCVRTQGEAQVKSLKPLPNLSMSGSEQSEITAMEIGLNFVNYFDPQAGHMVLSVMDMTMNLSLVVTVGGQGAAAMQMPAAIENGQMHMEMRYKPVE